MLHYYVDFSTILTLENEKRRVMFLSFTFLVNDNQGCRSNVFGKGINGRRAARSRDNLYNIASFYSCWENVITNK